MALDIRLKFTLSLDKTYITVTDITGAYDVDDNPGGYGGPNPATSDFTAFDIIATPADSVTLLPTGTAVTLDAYPTLPSSADGTFEITSLLLIGTADTVLIDGWYTFEIDATTESDGPYNDTLNFIIYQTVECCITNLTVKSVGCGCSATSKKITNLNKANLFLDQLRPRAVNDEVVESPVDECAQYNAAVVQLLELQDICDSNNCGGCNGC